jgi:hypothetical protein
VSDGANPRRLLPEHSPLQAYREARAAGRFAEAFDALQKLLERSRAEGDRAQEATLLTELEATLAASGDGRRAALIRHYRTQGFRRPLGYD